MDIGDLRVAFTTKKINDNGNNGAKFVASVTSQMWMTELIKGDFVSVE